MKRFSVGQLLFFVLLVALAVHLVQQNAWRVRYVYIGRLEFPDQDICVDLFREQEVRFRTTYVHFSVWRGARQLASLKGTEFVLSDAWIENCRPSDFKAHISGDKQYLGVEYLPHQEFLFLLDLKSETFEISLSDAARLEALFEH